MGRSWVSLMAAFIMATTCLWVITSWIRQHQLQRKHHTQSFTFLSKVHISGHNKLFCSSPALRAKLKKCKLSVYGVHSLHYTDSWPEIDLKYWSSLFYFNMSLNRERSRFWEEVRRTRWSVRQSANNGWIFLLRGRQTDQESVSNDLSALWLWHIWDEV